jgi:hypothetical protein
MPSAPGASGAPFGASAPAGVQHSIVYQQPKQNAATHLRGRRYFFLLPRDARRGRAKNTGAARHAGALVEVDRAGRAADLHHNACGGARRRRRFGAAGRGGAPGGSLAPAASAMVKICAVGTCCVEAGGTDMERSMNQ